MYQQISFDLVRSFDPYALSSLHKDRLLYHIIKRFLDLVLATTALVILSPLMLFISLLIVLDSPGSPIFAQERVGARRWTRNGYSYWKKTNFICYKFRTMVKNADPSLHKSFIKAFVEGNVKAPEETNANIKLTNDPRVTRFGHILRKTSLDELPQLFNVLRGEMSLVGPRPVPTYEVAEYKTWHYKRLGALPGITGLWQVRGRCQVPFEEMVRMDIEYADNQSLWLDTRILFLTVPAVLSTRGAE